MALINAIVTQMLNWNTDEQQFKRTDPTGYQRWRLVQLINYGVDEGKLNRPALKKHWPHIKDELFPENQKVLEFYLWQKKWHKEPGLRPDRKNFWAWLHHKKTLQLRST